MLALFLITLLAFASCDSGGNSDGSNPESPGNDISSGKNPSPTLPSSVGKNPVSEIVGENSTKEIKLQKDDQYELLGLKAEGTALYYYGDENSPSEEDYPGYEYKYSWNAEKKEIYMTMQKTALLEELFADGNIGLLDYDAAVLKLNSFSEKDLEKEYKADEEYYKDKYECESYERYVAVLLEEYGCETVDEFVKMRKENGIIFLKTMFEAKVTCVYEIKNGKMTLAEKFTGVKNLLGSSCVCDYSDGNSSYSILIEREGIGIGSSSSDSVSKPNGSSTDTDEATFAEFDIDTITDKISEKIQKSDYTENIEAETVTMKIDGKELVFKFKGETYTQVSE